MSRRPMTLLTVMLAFAGLADGTPAAEDTLVVGVFSGHGGSVVSRQNAFEALRLDPAIEPRLVSATDILNGALDSLDALVLPGGSGSRQMANLGELAVARLRAFVLEQGKGIVGLCAGAYMLSDTPNYLCLHLAPLAAIDRQHDERGHGIVAFSVTDVGLELLPELAGDGPQHIYYYEGPLLVPTRAGDQAEVLATFVTDVHLENDAPAGLMPGKPLLARAEAGRGRVFLCSGHPEATPGLRWMVPRMVRWVTQRETVAYPSAVVRPSAHEHVILFDEPLRNEEHDLLEQLRCESAPKDRVHAIRRVAEMRSWGAADWIVGSLRSTHPAVQQAAAVALSELEATWALPDLRAVLELDLDAASRASLEHAAACLATMVEHGNEPTGCVTPMPAPEPTPSASSPD